MSDADAPPRGDSRPVRTLSVAWQTIDGETVLLRTKEKANDKELLGLNDVGRRVWEMADGANSIDAMVAAVAADYEVSVETARADVLRFIDELVSLGALQLERG
jgi:Coenzyme PQQ synthesis protein D (PqqD)